jgi:type VI secretion system protein ImpE
MSLDADLRANRPREALRSLQGLVKQMPANLGHRSRLFQILCILGEWDRAQTQLKLLPELEQPGGELALAAPAYLSLIDCERFREEVFAGKRTPLVLGEPAEWLGLLVESLRALAQGQLEAATSLRERACEQAPASPGRLNGQPFEWIADGDTRLGPVLEVMLEGKYYWVPFCRVNQVVLEPPANLQDRVWLAAEFTWTNGGQVQGYIPTRYPGTPATEDGALQMAASVLWKESGPGLVCGLGQRVLVTDAAEVPLLKVREVVLNNSEP